MSSESKVTIKIPRPLYRRLKSIIGGSGFDSVTDFVVYVLRDIASSGETKVESDRAGKDSDRLTPEEVEMVKQRLRSLGYL